VKSVLQLYKVEGEKTIEKSYSIYYTITLQCKKVFMCIFNLTLTEFLKIIFIIILLIEVFNTSINIVICIGLNILKQ